MGQGGIPRDSSKPTPLQPDGKEVTIRWNSTAGYARIGREWNDPQSLVSDHPSLCEGGNVIVAKIFWRDRSEHDKPKRLEEISSRIYRLSRRRRGIRRHLRCSDRIHSRRFPTLAA